MENKIRAIADRAGEYTDFESGLCTDHFLEEFARLIILEYKREEKESRREIKSKLGYSRIGLNNV